MKKLFLLLTLSFSIFLAVAQDMQYSRVRIYTAEEGIRKLLALGIPLDDGEVRQGAFVTCEISLDELARVKAEGFEVEVLIDDVAKFYEERSRKEMDILDQLKDADYVLNREWTVPAGFALGSVGGFCDMEEMMDHLDNMIATYPDLISPVYPMDELTHEGRPMYWIRISDNPSQNEDEPEVLYTGMHHAREPIGMQHLLFFMYYLLENYESDPEIQYIIQNTELYFVPVLNPDGYARNILTNPNGGGQWRKNRRDNGGSYGVDLNRNYGFAWGYDNSGSSPTPSDATYRGPSAFSEPENQNIRDFCEAHEFRIALNYHSYANLLLYAWGYIPDFPPDYDIIDAYASIMTKENDYTFGPGYSTIYATNGGSDDWMYGEQTTKDKIFAYTPEIGGSNDGFWPSPSRIIPLCQENMWQSMMAAKLAGPYAEGKDASSSIVETVSGYFHFELKRLGMDETGIYTVSIVPLNDAIATIGDPIVYNDLELLESVDDSLAYSLKADIKNGDEILYLLSVNNGFYTASDTIRKIYGIPLVVFEDDGNTFEKWSSNKWNTTTEDFHSADKSITDSPFANYNNYEISSMVLDEPIDLTDAVYAVLGFWAKWEIEPGYDFVQVEASINGQSWIPLEGQYTREGTDDQAPGEPVYDGFQTTWVQEEMSLEDFIGQQIYLRFLLKADSYVVEDGFYWDDMTVTIVDITTGVGEPGYAGTFRVVGPVPNPAAGQVSFALFPETPGEDVSLSVFNSTGRQMHSVDLTGMKNYTLPLNGWSPGVYFYRFTVDGLPGKSGKFIVR